MNTIITWYHNARPAALPQSLLPAVLALCMASQKDTFSIWLGLAAVAGVVAGHLGINLFDDYFDYKVKKTDFRDRMQHRGMRARILKCVYLTSGHATVGQLLAACIAFCAFSLVTGFVIYLYRGNVIAILALASALLGLSYSGAPLRLSYRGLGEIVIGLMFGPMLMTGVYYAACGTIDRSALFVSIPVGLLVANIVYTHAIMDCDPDREVGKMTFACLLKTKKRMLICLFLLLAVSFATIVGGVMAGYLSPFYLFTLLTLPMACGLYYLMVEFVRHPDRTFTPRFWMGYMGDWKRICEYGVDWFMIRWLVSRNLLSLFCLILMTVSLLV